MAKCRSGHCETEILAAGVEFCGDCQRRLAEATKAYPRIKERPSDYAFLRRHGAGAELDELLTHLGFDPSQVYDLVDLTTGKTIKASTIRITRRNAPSARGASRILPVEIARVILGYRENTLSTRGELEWKILGRYPDLSLNPSDIVFLRANLEEGCASLELATQIGMPRATLIGLISQGRIRAKKAMRQRGRRKSLTWTIAPMEIARVTTIYRYHIGLFTIAQQHRGVIEYYTLRKYVRGNKHFGRRLRTLTGAEAIHLSQTEGIVARYQAIRDQHLPQNRSGTIALEPDELLKREVASLFGDAPVETLDASLRKANVPHARRSFHDIYRWGDIADYLKRVIAKDIPAGSRINPISAGGILAGFSNGYVRTSPEPSK